LLVPPVRSTSLLAVALEISFSHFDFVVVVIG
jgi:hypothetical protein